MGVDLEATFADGLTYCGDLAEVDAGRCGNGRLQLGRGSAEMDGSPGSRS